MKPPARTDKSDRRPRTVSQPRDGGEVGRTEPGEAPLGKALIVLDDRALDRQCFAYCISARKKDLDVLALGSLMEWERVQQNYPRVAAILLNVGSKRASEPAAANQIRYLCATQTAPLIVLADGADLRDIMNALEYGAKGYVPTSTSIDICVEAIALTMAGGVFVPVSVIREMHEANKTDRLVAGLPPGVFTERQTAVMAALRRGKANKIIAEELNLGESTVKVHIRNIMKKLNATNRTEIAYKIRDFFPILGDDEDER
jgi:DNA-binding NarL/FixJ family response regulator